MILQDILTRSVNYDSSLEESVLNKFCVKQGGISVEKDAFFSQLWQGFAWATIIGFIHNKRLKLTNPLPASFKMSVISNQNPLIFKSLILMAISKSKNGIEILEDPSKIVMILSEYAKGGAEYIEEIRATPGKANYFNSPEDFIEEIMDR